MIGKLNHVAIAVPDIADASRLYRDVLRAKVSEPITLAEHGVITVFVEINNTKIELIHPLDRNSSLKKFLAKNPSGGMHHMCFEVENILQARDKLIEAGARVLGDKNPQIGAHGKPVLFLHPKDFCGTLIELEQA